MKKNKVKPTEKQKRAVKLMVENGGNVSKSMREAGYEPATAKNPKKLTESQGFKMLCDKVGLTDDFVLECLTEDIKLKPQNRKGELELASKIKGMVINRQEITGKDGKDLIPEDKRRTISERLKDLL